MAKKNVTPLERASYSLSHWIGSTESLLWHTFVFAGALMMSPVVGFERILLIVTTIVSLEAIYLSIFIQMTVNRQHQRIKGIEDDIDDIQEDLEDFTEEK